MNIYNNNVNVYLQLGGRLLLVLLFISILHLEIDAWNIMKNIIGGSMMILVAIGELAVSS